MERKTMWVSDNCVRLLCRAEEGACVGKPYTCPDQMPECPTNREALKTLARYEDEEEQGRLIHLPCRMHATIYMVVTKRARAYSAKPFRFVKTSYMTWNNLESVLRNFGKTVFLTHEEAVAAMNKMNEGDRNGPVL